MHALLQVLICTMKILLKLYAHINLFRHIEEKYGQKEIKLARVIHKQRSPITKIERDINYLLFCKRNNLALYLQDQNFRSGLVTIYAIKLDVKYWKLKSRINIEKNKTLKQQLKNNSEFLANKFRFICKIVLYQKIKSVIGTPKIGWNKTQYDKMERFKLDYRKFDKPKRPIVESIIHNFSSCKLTPEEKHALSFSLDDHIPTKQNDIKRAFITKYLNTPTS